LSLLLAACGGPTQAEPTAIPAGVVRPVQPTPQYSTSAGVFSLLTPAISPQFVPTATARSLGAGDASAGSERAAIALFIENQTPSAVGIAPGGAAIYATRGGRALASIPVGGVVTVTGKSADGAWYSAYNDAAVFGWVPAGQLRVYGDDDLVVVEEAPDPAPVATLLAQAAVPVRVLDDLLAQFDATATAAAQPPAATPLPATATPTAPAETPAEALAETPTPAPSAPPTEEAPEDLPASAAQAPAALAAGTQGIVTSDGRLNLRQEPDTAAAIVRKLDPGTAVTILAPSPDAAWLRVQLAGGAEGWVAAEFIAPAP
jgi:hypothetical protein